MLQFNQKGCIPKTTTAEVTCRTKGITCEYRVAQGENPSSLREIYYQGREVCRLTFGGHWTLDLEAHALAGLDFIRSHGRDEVTPATATTGNAITHWYLQLHDKPILIVRRKLHRLAEEMREDLYFHTESVMTKRLIRLKEAEAVVILDEGTEAVLDGKRVRLCSTGWMNQNLWCFGPLAEKIRQTPKLRITLVPDLELPGAYLLKGEPNKLSVEIQSKQELGKAEVMLCGAVQCCQRVHLSKGKNPLSIKVISEQEGFLPVCVLIEGKDFVAIRVFECFVIPTEVKSPDHRFNGVYVEYLRSMHERHFFNAVPEEDPRGEMRYHHGFWPRNIHGGYLYRFGFDELGLEVTKAFGYLLEKYRFLFDAYSLRGEEVFSNPLVSISNDGVGFYLFQAGKILLRKPEVFDEDFRRGIAAAVQWLNWSTHWNGLLVDKTEAVDHCRSERLSGNPYSQGICMAGLKIISRALKLVDELLLAEEAERVFERQMKGFEELYRKVGYFRDLLAGPPARLSDYSMPCPSAFLLDPEVDDQRLIELMDKTIAVLLEKQTAPHNRWMIEGSPGATGASYGQLGTIASLLNLGRPNEAWGFLNELLNYAESTNLKYVLPEGIFFKRNEEESDEGKFAAERYERVRRHCMERTPWLYHKGSEKLFGFPSNPGNLVHMSYYLFVVDLICGISHGEDEKTLRIAPKVPAAWESFAVKNYRTRFGELSYHLKRRAEGISLELTKPLVAAEVVLGPLPEVRRIAINGVEVEPKLSETPEGMAAKVRCSGELGTISVEVS
ncbi:MAG TPA: hypothetical protein EYP53_05770 [Candidatus Latescibacteria bacterium]|nr:hypothetical protein [Candidatus Latescibacterota bacterium]